VLAQALLRRASDDDMREAQTVVDRLAAFPGEPAIGLIDVPVLRLRALLSRAEGDRQRYWDFRDRYRAMAFDLGFEGHMKWAEAMQ
jgi:adenylate cyclase